MLENWGLLWIWHSVVVLLLCLLTNFLQEQGIESPGPYLLIWIVGFRTGQRSSGGCGIGADL